MYFVSLCAVLCRSLMGVVTIVVVYCFTGLLFSYFLFFVFFFYCLFTGLLFAGNQTSRT